MDGFISLGTAQLVLEVELDGAHTEPIYPQLAA